MAQTTDSLSAIRATLAELLEHRHIAPLKHLFWEYLQFEKKQTPLPRADLPPDLAYSLAEDLLLFAASGELVVINVRLPTPDLPISTERVLVAHLHRAYHRAIFVISNRSQSRWHFVYVQPPPEHSDNDPNAPFSFSRRVVRRLALEVEEDCPFAASRLAQLGRPASQTGLTEQEEAVEVVFDRNALAPCTHHHTRKGRLMVSPACLTRRVLATRTLSNCPASAILVANDGTCR